MKPQSTKTYAVILLLGVSVVGFGFLFGSKPNADLLYVANVDLTRYMGKWYAVKEIPNYLGVYPFGYDSQSFAGETATYSLNADGSVKVVNFAFANGEPVSVEGVARVVEGGKLEVSFFGPFYAPYQIIGLDSEYQWAVVGSPSHNYLWYLSREPMLSEVELGLMDAIAVANGFDLSQLIFVNQNY